MNRLTVRRPQDNVTKSRLVSAVMTRLPRAWFNPSTDDLVSLYTMHYRRALEEGRYDSAMIFLDKILEADPANIEAKLRKGEIYHRHLHDLGKALECYGKVIRLTATERSSSQYRMARSSMDEIMELLS